MAVTQNGLKYGGDALTAATAAGATIPTVTEITGAEYIHDVVINVDKAAVDDTTEALTYNAILASVETTMEAKITADFIATQTVTSHGVLSRITMVRSTDFLSTAESYNCFVKVFTKSV